MIESFESRQSRDPQPQRPRTGRAAGGLITVVACGVVKKRWASWIEKKSSNNMNTAGKHQTVKKDWIDPCNSKIINGGSFKVSLKAIKGGSNQLHAPQLIYITHKHQVLLTVKHAEEINSNINETSPSQFRFENISYVTQTVIDGRWWSSHFTEHENHLSGPNMNLDTTTD